MKVAGRGRRREQEEPRGEGDPSRRHNVLCGVCVLCVCVARVVRVCVCIARVCCAGMRRTIRNAIRGGVRRRWRGQEVMERR